MVTPTMVTPAGHIHGLLGYCMYYNEPYKVRSSQKLLSLKWKLKRHHLRSPQFLFQLYQLSAKFGPKLIVGSQTKIIQFSL